MENFFKLRADKQEHIIDAALTVFGRNGYKKSSIADIAEEAGIAKSMVLYYFGSKKHLYLYLAELCGSLFVEEMNARFDRSVADFFDKIKMITDIKVAMIKKHSAIISFLTSIYYETDREVRDDIRKMLSGGANIRGQWVFEGTNVSAFKNDIDPEILTRFLVWAGEGIACDLALDTGMDKLDESVEAFYKCLDFMKRHFYKEESPWRA